jgi:hypothetical protein
MSEDKGFVAILVDEASGASKHEQDRGYRYRVWREEGESRIYLFEEQVWPECVNKPDANHFRHQNEIGLTRDQARWMHEQIGNAIASDTEMEADERRAADLTAEEREALAWAYRWLDGDERRPQSETNRAKWQRALAVLDRLLSQGGGR